MCVCHPPLFKRTETPTGTHTHGHTDTPPPGPHQRTGGAFPHMLGENGPADLHWLCKVRLEWHLQTLCQGDTYRRAQHRDPHLCRGPGIPVWSCGPGAGRRSAFPMARGCCPHGTRLGGNPPAPTIYGERDRVQAAGPGTGSQGDPVQSSLRAGVASPCVSCRPHDLVVLFGPGLGEAESVWCLGLAGRKWKQLRFERWAPGLVLCRPGLMASPGQGLGDRREFLRAGSAAPRGTREAHSTITVTRAGRGGRRAPTCLHGSLGSRAAAPLGSPSGKQAFSEGELDTAFHAVPDWTHRSTGLCPQT